MGNSGWENAVTKFDGGQEQAQVRVWIKDRVHTLRKLDMPAIIEGFFSQMVRHNANIPTT
jgi:hypothetical protein